jgi:ferredoxin-NADP reductase
MTININPGFPNLSIDVWNPDGANATEGFSEQYFAPGVSEEFAKELIAFNKEVGAQDDVLTDSVQRGLLGGLPERGRLLTNSEHLVIHFQKLIVNAVTGEPAALTPSGLVALPPVLRTIPLLPNASVVPDSERNAYVELEIFKIEPESEIISSFYMRRADGKPLDPWVPGQFLPIRVTIPSEPQPALRTYTLSTTPNPDYYRLSIRRGDENSLVSRFLHANGRPGLRIEAMTPRGKFMLTPQSERPAVFVSGGVGITPMIAMATHIVEEGRRTGKFRPVWFIHGTSNGRVHAFGNVKELAGQHPAMKVHIRYSQPGSTDRLGITHDSEGRITIDVLKELLPLNDYDFYLCGPPPFMQSLYDGLTGIGVRRERIHYESFGSGTALKPELHPEIPARISASDDGSVPIRFAKSGITAEWSRDKGSLLEFAEAVGLAPVFGCRSGICGTCATRITSGAVDYIEEPLAPRGEGQVLLCCSVPAAAALVPAWCSTYRGIDPSKRRRNGATASRSVYLPL